MQLNVRPFITGISIIPLRILIHNLQLMAKESSWGCRTVAAKVGVPKVDEAAVSCAGEVRGGAVVVSMLSAETPATGLPEGAFFDCMTQGILVALKAIWECDFVSLMSFAKYSPTL